MTSAESKHMPHVMLVLTGTRQEQHRGAGSFGGVETVDLPCYEVRFDGEPVGVVRRDMVTRESRTPGKRYVNRRWTVPAWVIDGDRRQEVPSRRAAVAGLLIRAGLERAVALNLAATARVVKPRADSPTEA